MFIFSPLIFDSFLSSHHSLKYSPIYLSLPSLIVPPSFHVTLSSFPFSCTCCMFSHPSTFAWPLLPTSLSINPINSHLFTFYLLGKQSEENICFFLERKWKWVEKKADSESKRRENGEKKGGMLPEEMMKPKNECQRENQGDREGKMAGRRDSLLSSW